MIRKVPVESGSCELTLPVMLAEQEAVEEKAIDHGGCCFETLRES